MVSSYPECENAEKTSIMRNMQFFKNGKQATAEAILNLCSHMVLTIHLYFYCQITSLTKFVWPDKPAD